MKKQLNTWYNTATDGQPDELEWIVCRISSSAVRFHAGIISNGDFISDSNIYPAADITDYMIIQFYLEDIK